MHDPRLDCAEMVGRKVESRQGGARISEFGSVAEARGVATGVCEPDPAGLFAIGIEARDDGSAEFDGGGLCFAVNSNAHDSVARTDCGRSDQRPFGSEEQALPRSEEHTSE